MTSALTPACTGETKVCAACAYKATTEEGDEDDKAKVEARKETRRLTQIARRAAKKHADAAEQSPRGPISKRLKGFRPSRATTSAASATRATLPTKSAAQLAAEAQACIRHAQCTYTAHALHSRGMAQCARPDTPQCIRMAGD